ncbi:hypothetical protein GCM10023187_56270 [Nibrella viscosa]|uniref:Membrane or secreted protein n=1 Tax=Nibrella viscosa TaxID=1084524 RepID=A0ABP8L1C5_9BACT
MMRKSLILLLIVTAGWLVAAQQGTPGIAGAWRETNAVGGPTTVLIASDGYLMQTDYRPNEFVSTRGGTMRQDGKLLNLLVEFDTKDSTRIGGTETYELAFSGNKMTLLGRGGRRTFERVDQPSTQTPLAGLWRITGRLGDDGQINAMQRGPRKTLKLLTGTRFQWAAINPQTKLFAGTGGGTYTLKDGKYTETIDFFSRDNSRVGKSLTFDAEIKGTDWFHRGQSSTGGKVSEVWSRE